VNLTKTFAGALFALPVAAQAQMANPAPSPSVVPLPVKYAAKPTTGAITAADLMSRLYVFADDSMMGREAGTLGNVKGTDYIAAEVKKLGLVPAGENGGYFQTIPFKTRSVNPASVMSVGGQPLAFGTDFVLAGATPLTNPALQVVYGGELGDTANTLPAGAGAGKLVVFRMPGNGSPRAVRGAGRAAQGAAAVAIVGVDQYLPFFQRPTTFVDDPNNAPPAATPATVVISTAAAPRLFDAPFASLKPGAAGKTVNANVTFAVAPVQFPARNVVAVLPGSDAKLKGQYVAIGAHNDHVGMTVGRAVDHDSLRLYNHLVRPGGAEDAGKTATPEQQAQVNTMLASWRAAHPNGARLDSISNGADDDGTGSVSVLEIAEHLSSMKTKPKRSTLFVWHVGEEKGLLGSAYFTDHPTVPRDSIVAQLNIDMVGRGAATDQTGMDIAGKPLVGGGNYLQLVGSRRLSTELGDLVEKVNTSGKYGFRFDYGLDTNGHPMNIYCRSDHYEYARYGIPVVFFTTGGHSDYHQVTDEPQYIQYDHMGRVDQLISDVLVHVSNLDHRVVVDKAKPDPKGTCRQ
jgi:hypothetical protein